MKRASPMRGRAMPWYGQIDVKNNPEAAAIWRTREDEPDLLEPCIFSTYYAPDHGRDEEIEIGAKLFEMLERMTPKQAKVIELRFRHGLTLDEIGNCMEITRERVRQIEQAALRKLRSPEMAGTLPRPYLPKNCFYRVERPAHCFDEWKAKEAARA